MCTLGRLRKESEIERSSLLVHDSSPVNTAFWLIVFRLWVIKHTCENAFLFPERKQHFKGRAGLIRPCQISSSVCTDQTRKDDSVCVGVIKPGSSVFSKKIQYCFVSKGLQNRVPDED